MYVIVLFFIIKKKKELSMFKELELFEIFLNIFLWVRLGDETGYNIFRLFDPQLVINIICDEFLSQLHQTSVAWSLGTISELLVAEDTLPWAAPTLGYLFFF